MEAPPMHDESTVDPSAPIVLLAGASLCELISASLACSQQLTCSGLRAYAVSVGLVSIVLLAPIALVNFAEPLAPRRLYEGLPQISLLLLMWWMPACFLLTFVAPFSTLGNGYFATLGGAAGALQLSRAYVPALDTALHTVREMARDAPPDRAVLVMLALSSTLMWVQAAISAALYGDTPATKAWAIIVGVVSSVLCAFFLLLEGLTIHRLGFAMLMAAWWCQGIALSFVPNSFIGSINGFVTCWSSVFLAFYFLRTTRTPHDLLPVPSAPPDEEGLGGPTTVYHEAVGSSEGLDGTWAASGSGSHVVQTEPPRLGQESAKAFRHTPS